MMVKVISLFFLIVGLSLYSQEEYLTITTQTFTNPWSGIIMEDFPLIHAHNLSTNTYALYSIEGKRKSLTNEWEQLSISIYPSTFTWFSPTNTVQSNIITGFSWTNFSCVTCPPSPPSWKLYNGFFRLKKVCHPPPSSPNNQ